VPPRLAGVPLPFSAWATPPWISLLPVLSAVFRRPGRTRKSGDFAGAEPRNPR